MTSTDTRPTADPEPSPRRASAWTALKPLILRLHFYAGVLIAPFLLVAACTGLLYAASFQIEQIVHRHELSVPVGQQRLPLTQQAAAAQTARPDGTITAVRTPDGADASTRVLMDVPGLPESTQLAVFVDPYTGQVRGTLDSYGSSGALPVRAWISNLHRHLHLGEPGRLYSELAASWLWIVALGGLTLWITRRRRTRRLRGLLAPDQSLPAARRRLSWHGSVGLWAVLGLLFLSATGLTWSKYAGENVGEVRTALGWTTPAITTSSGDHAAHAGEGGHQHSGTAVNIDQVTQAAAGEGLSGPLEIVWPTELGAPYVIKEIDTTVPQRLDQVAVDATSGQVTAVLRFTDYNLAAKLTQWGIDGHMGLLFGLANQIVLMLLAAGVITLIVLGYRMWWQRRPTRGFGTPYPRGGWRRVHGAVLVPLVLIVAAVGWFLPLMGLSLLAFLAVDVLLGLRARVTREKA
ncbi:PepSY-associated TM helix domain-containing protein [Nonomuraea diastatica]|uniref:PepSY domain-containing protein n=1 Tax=Nonomuraea diastatica TaxID=1848329 RepID=A0A4R4WNT8_9ACTN|nr:PepSY domain-containing protein [Nonomuraea diastatica]TDD18704.1 PepSY domain-containing protein [Nonomuraea diastatica]